MDLYFPYSFQAAIQRFGVGKSRKIYYHVLFLPDSLRAHLPFDRHPRLRLEGEIADVPVANAFIPSGDGRYYVIVAPQVLRDGRVFLGDQVEMRFRIAEQSRVEVPAALLAALLAALQVNPLASQAWHALTRGKQRMLAQHVLSAKTPPTSARRIQEVLEALLELGGDLRSWLKAKRTKTLRPD